MKDSQFVSATELATLGYCEQLLVYKMQYGERSTREQHVRRQEGLLAHAQFARAGADIGARVTSVDRRCFIAHAVFAVGDVELLWLRHLRDNILQKSAVGRLFIKWYYRRGPWLAKMVVKAALVWPVRVALRLVYWGYRRWVMHCSF